MTAATRVSKLPAPTASGSISLGVSHDGTGAPPIGPVDIVVESDRIAEVVSVGYPELEIAEARRPPKGTREIDAHGMYVIPGMIDTHTHISTSQQAAFGVPSPAEYVFKLWLAHGVTTVRDVGSVNGLEWTLDQMRKSDANEITAPRIVPYAMFPLVEFLRLNAEEARQWMRDVAEGDWSPPLVKTVAAREEGIGALLEACDAHRADLEARGILEAAAARRAIRGAPVSRGAR